MQVQHGRGGCENRSSFLLALYTELSYNRERNRKLQERCGIGVCGGIAGATGMKEKSILKMILHGYAYLFLGGLLCLIVAISISVFGLPGILRDLLTLCCVVPLYIMLLHSLFWTEGDRNRNMVGFGHIKEDRAKGFKVGLFLTLPYLLENVMLTLSRTKVIPDFYWLYKLLNAHIWPILNFFLPPESKVIGATSLSIGGLIVCWLFTLYPLVIATASYILGYHGISVVQKLVYKNKPRKVK